MTNQITTLEVQHRFILGKQVKELRREGVTPVHLYGPGISSQSLQVDGAILTRVLSESGRTRPLTIQIAPDGEEHLVFIGNVQFHPVTNAVIHVSIEKGLDYCCVASNKRNPGEVVGRRHF